MLLNALDYREEGDMELFLEIFLWVSAFTNLFCVFLNLTARHKHKLAYELYKTKAELYDTYFKEIKILLHRGKYEGNH